jgi:F0F1-type ATP synthase delta subunit
MSLKKNESKDLLAYERNMLKITLDHLIQENQDLRRQIEDMKMTVRTKKELLKEYVYNITNKDKVVEKMSITIEHLQNRIASLEEIIKNGM